jgi:hypothetical protein
MRTPTSPPVIESPDVALCGDVSEFITYVPDGEGKRIGVICARPAFHANPYHATADERHEWHVEHIHWIHALASRDADIERLKAAHQLQYEECLRQVAEKEALWTLLKRIDSAALDIDEWIDAQRRASR